MNLTRKLLAALVVVLGASAPAFASEAFLSGTATSNTITGYTISNTSNILGGSDLNTADIHINADSAAATVTWTLGAGLSVDISQSNQFRLTIWTADDDPTQISAVLSQVTFTDTGSHQITVSSGFGDVTPAAAKKGVSSGVFAFNVSYSPTGGFDPANIASISFDLAVTTTKNAKNINFGVDAVAVSSVPEPGAFALFALGAVGLGVLARRRTRRSAKTAAK
jgi:hypothetical protein